MGFWGRVKSYFSRSKPSSSSPSTSTSSSSSSSSPSTSTSSSGGGGSSGRTYSSGSSTIPQKELAPVRSIDYVDSSGKGAGATTLSGTKVWSSSGGGGSSSGTRVLSTTFSPSTTQSLTGSSPDTQTKVLAPNDLRTTATQLKPKSQTKTGWLAPNVYVPPQDTGLPAGASYISPMPYYHDPIQKDKQSLASYNKMSLGQSIKQGWLGTDGYQITDTLNVLGGIQGGVSYFSDTYGGSKPITIPDTKYFSSGSGAYNSTTGEYYQPKTDTHTRLRTIALLNPDLSQPAGQVSERKRNEVISTLTPKYTSLASGATSQAQIDKINNQFQNEATNLYMDKIEGLDIKRSTYSKDVYGANVNAPSGLITTGALIGAGFVGGIPAVTASYLIGGQGLKTGFEGAREGDILKTGIGALQFGLGGYYGAKGTANIVTQSRITALQNTKPSFTIGTRSVKGSYALDKEFYVKNTKYGTSTTESFTITKLGDKGGFGGFGMRSDIINVKDAWSGKNMILQNTNIYTNTGKLLPTTSGGWTPSTYLSKSTGYQASYFKDTLKFDTTPIKTTAGGGRTAQLEGGYVFSQSGSNVKLSRIYTETQFSGANYFKDVGIVKNTLGFNKDAVSLLKLNKITPPSSTGSGGTILISSGGGTSTGSLSNINQMFSASQIPQIATKSSITNIAKVSGGVSVAGIGGVSLLSNVKASTIQIPKVDTTTTFKGGQQLKVIPTSRSGLVNIPASRSSSSSSSSLIQIPAITQIPATRISTTQIQKPFTGQLGRGRGIGMPTFGFSGSFIPALILPPMGADMGGLGKRKIQARKIVAYTPSFNAMFYGIKGSKPKGIETGLRIRPITKGFKFATIFKKAKKLKRRYI